MKFRHLGSQKCCYFPDCPPTFHHSSLTPLSCQHTLRPGLSRKIQLFALSHDLNLRKSSQLFYSLTCTKMFSVTFTMPAGSKVVFKRSKVKLPSKLVGSFERLVRTYFADKTGSQVQPASAICCKLKMKYWRVVQVK